MAELDPTTLLAQLVPVIQYDSLEAYYADSAAVITDRPGNLLRRADDSVLAGDGRGAELTLALLAPNTYANGVSVQPGDYLDESGKDYVAQAREMHARPGYANRVHGRAVEQQGRLWLQYWFFMYYDNPGLLRLGCHEGDIEMIQIRLDAQGSPDVVSCSQHRSGVRANWSEVERADDSPVVYSARGSHACMLRSGTSRSLRSLIPDHNDGAGQRITPVLVTLNEEASPWAYWPGTWGSTRPDSTVLGKLGIETSSPASLPSRLQWHDPAAFHASCDEVELPPVGQPQRTSQPAPATPQLTVHPDPARGMATVSYQLPPGGAQATHLVLAVDSTTDRMPPVTTTIPVEDPVGEAEVPMPADPDSLEVRATAHSEDGVPSPTATVQGG